jgi:hypothetical protein
VLPQIDELRRLLDGIDQRVGKCALLAHSREDGTVVIDVDVHVEQRHAGERRPDRVEHRGVATLREVRHGLERELHATYSTSA